MPKRSFNEQTVIYQQKQRVIREHNTFLSHTSLKNVLFLQHMVSFCGKLATMQLTTINVTCLNYNISCYNEPILSIFL